MGAAYGPQRGAIKGPSWTEGVIEEKRRVGMHLQHIFIVMSAASAMNKNRTRRLIAYEHNVLTPQ
jgi:hypothetical protein